jgi:1-acyl-sn-glycerol-3-phosphate acyltransferase
MALTAQAPVVPVAIHGGRAAMRKGSYLVWPAVIRITVGEPIETRGRTLLERDRLIAETRERISAMLPS